ncbi:DUF3530 family protein [Idiomarina xiamenensis]|uniref:DUF3530 domain-containing protein n=1 Tax=Idiomarina xiamenensis 10-D-4 TaxID=740709 RepID=K2KLL8_9GAMM|nr:DUF3530 family protein [Idiomarina xiamenensis]EKE87482.1 hypothetical protein A10D4_00260 [Idiomarina xiamenensis 10-D-4]
MLFGSAQAADDYARYLPPGETRWLSPSQSNENEQQSTQRFLLLERESLRSFSRGVLLSLPDWGYHPLQSAAVRQLYQFAPSIGWRSWALTPPDTDLRGDMLQIPAVDERFPEAVDDEQLQPLLDALRARLSVAAAQRRDYPGFYVLIVEGMTAALSLRLLSEDAGLRPDALVIIDPYLPQYRLNQALPKTLAQLPLPVLDVMTSRSNRWSLASADKRRQFADKYQQVSYRQRRLIGADSQQQAALTKLVQGWLKQQGY